MSATPRRSFCNDEFPVLSFMFALYCDPDFEIEHRRWSDSVKSIKVAVKAARLGAASQAAPTSQELQNPALYASEYRPTLEELRDPGIYVKYLDYYAGEQKNPSVSEGGTRRTFPTGAVRLITEDVPLAGYIVFVKKDAEYYYAPTNVQVADGVYKYILPELTGVATVKEQTLKPPYPPGLYDLSPAREPGVPPSPHDRPERTPASRYAPNAERPILGCLAAIFLDGNLGPASAFRADPDAFLKPHHIPDAIRSVLKTFAASGERHMPSELSLALAPALVDELKKPPPHW